MSVVETSQSFSENIKLVKLDVELSFSQSFTSKLTNKNNHDHSLVEIDMYYNL